MKPLFKMNVFLVIVITLLSASGANAAGIGNNIVVLLAGTAVGADGTPQFNEFDLPVPAGGVTCFDMDLVDAKTGNVIGRGSDCLSDINSSDGLGFMMTATTFFYFPGGTLVSQGRVTVQPVLTGSPEFTHITGAVPSPYDNNVIYGDGKFKKAAGSVRLSGAVNMSELSIGKIFFDCVFVIDM